MIEAGRSRGLGVVLAIGAAYDLLFGVAILGFARPAAALLGLRVPDDPVYLYLNGVFLVILAAIYLVASRDPVRYESIAPIAALGRLIGFVFLVWAWHGGRPSAFLMLGAADLVLSIATFSSWWQARLSD